MLQLIQSIFGWNVSKKAHRPIFQWSIEELKASIGTTELEVKAHFYMNCDDYVLYGQEWFCNQDIQSMYLVYLALNLLNSHFRNNFEGLKASSFPLVLDCVKFTDLDGDNGYFSVTISTNTRVDSPDNASQ